MCTARIGTIFAMYTTPTNGGTTNTTMLPKQYKEYQNVFEKKNADMLLQH